MVAQKEMITMGKQKDKSRQIMKENIGEQFDTLLCSLRRLKPDNPKPGKRSEEARRLAVIITDLEKITMYYKTCVLDD